MAELVAQSILEQFKLNGKTALTVGGSRGPVLSWWMGCTVAGKIICPALFLICSFSSIALPGEEL